MHRMHDIGEKIKPTEVIIITLKLKIEHIECINKGQYCIVKEVQHCVSAKQNTSLSYIGWELHVTGNAHIISLASNLYQSSNHY